MSLKVCHFTVAHNVTDGRIFEKECRSLQRAGYRVCIVGPNTEDREIDGINICGVALNPHPLHRMFWGARKIYKRALALDADVYHFHDVELFRYGLKLKQKGKKVIFDSHENWIGYVQNISWIPSMAKKVVAQYLRRMYKKHLSEFDAVVTVSPDIAESLSQNSNHVCVVTNYPKIDMRKLPTLSFDEYEKRPNRLCYAGTVYPSSNQVTIIKALEALDDVEYVMIGKLDARGREIYSQLDGWNKVIVVNFLPFEHLTGYYQSSRAGLCVFDDIPNIGGRKGSMGVNKIFEYMAYGLPIILSDQEMWRDLIVEKYHCGVCVKAGDVESVMRGIQTILSDKHGAFEMGKRGQEAVINEFNWKTQEKVLLEVYEKITDKQDGRD